MLVTWRYRPRPKSFVQGLDPRAWMIFFGCFLVATVMTWDLRFLLPLLAIALFFIFSSRLTWRETRRAWLFITSFVVFFSVLTLITGRGGVEHYTVEHVLATARLPFSIFGWTPVLTVSAEKLMFAASMLVRVFSLASMTILIPYCINPALYGITFRGLGLPDKFAYAMDLTMRFIPTFGRDFQLTMDAQRARGYELEKLEGGLFAQVRKLAPLLVPVTIHAIAGSEDIIDAMDLRAFGVQARTWLIQLVYRRRDHILITLGVMLMVAYVAFSLIGYGRLWVPEALKGFPVLSG
jgi:energy-coupling factor transport system permease protein